MRFNIAAVLPSLKENLILALCVKFISQPVVQMYYHIRRKKSASIHPKVMKFCHNIHDGCRIKYPKDLIDFTTTVG